MSFQLSGISILDWDPYTIKVQKRSKEIGEIIHVTSGHFTKLWEYFLCTKVKK